MPSSSSLPLLAKTEHSAKSSKAKSSKTADAKAEKVASAKATKAPKTKSEKMSVSAKAAKAGGNIAVPVDPTPIIVGKTVYPLNGELEVIRRRETNLGQLVADSLSGLSMAT